jgi:two-component system sensor kinase FixL
VGRRHLRTSPRLNALFGFAPQVEATLEDFETRCHPDEADHLVAAVLQGGGGHFLHDFRIVDDGGATRWIHARGEALVGPTGAVERLRGVLLDITDRKRTEEALLALNEELKRRLREA